MTNDFTTPQTDLAPWEIEVLELFVGIFESFSLPKSTAMIYGVLYCSEEPLLQDDICQKLSISTGSASQGLKMLQNLGAVQRQSPVGQRQSVYTAERSMRRLIGTILDIQLRPKLRNGKERLTALVETLPENDEHARQRIQTLQNWQKKVEKGLPLISAFLGK